MTDFNEIKTDTTERMEKTLETLRNDFGGLRAGRAHASLLDNIMVEAYGTPTPIAQGCAYPFRQRLGQRNRQSC